VVAVQRESFLSDRTPTRDNSDMKRQLCALTDGDLDLLILGGGITGAGVALDAALRGLCVGLIDKGDFAGGTSSISSKLVHGGLRYLEHGEVRLVYEALHERGRLLRNAPHLVRPLRFVLPFGVGDRVPSWKWRAGLLLYDLLAGSANIHRARSLPLGPLCREFPGLHRHNLHGAAEYHDAQMDDARLCLEVVRSAALNGARVANHVEATVFEKDGGRLSGVRAVDRLTGNELRIRARVILNAAGPWVDSVRRLAGDSAEPLLAPTKGVHLVAPDRGFSSAFLLLHPTDGRVFFVIPWLGKTLIGTTDTEWTADPDGVRATEDDVAYLLTGHNHYFDPPLSSKDLLGTFAGLRPLLRSSGTDPSARSREYRIVVSPCGLLTVAGGKYTTYRAMAETITDAVVHRLGLRRRCRTRDFRLDGAPPGDWPTFAEKTRARLGSQYRLDEKAARHLLQRYGRRALDVAAYVERDPALAQPVVAGEPDLRAELAYQRDHEMALTPADFLLRRTRLGLFHPELLTKIDFLQTLARG
jgi:glycerol-3-phosphate dehydrogenase